MDTFPTPTNTPPVQNPLSRDSATHQKHARRRVLAVLATLAVVAIGVFFLVGSKKAREEKKAADTLHAVESALIQSAQNVSISQSTKDEVLKSLKASETQTKKK